MRDFIDNLFETFIVLVLTCILIGLSIELIGR